MRPSSPLRPLRLLPALILVISGKTSNELAIDVARPGGAPLLPRDADPAPGKSLEPAR